MKSYLSLRNIPLATDSSIQPVMADKDTGNISLGENDLTENLLSTYVIEYHNNNQKTLLSYDSTIAVEFERKNNNIIEFSIYIPTTYSWLIKVEQDGETLRGCHKFDNKDSASSPLKIETTDSCHIIITLIKYI